MTKKRFFIAAFLLISALLGAAALLATPAGAADAPVFLLFDNGNVISDGNREILANKGAEAVARTGFNIIILTSDDVGSSKSDSAVVDYADVFYEQQCGKNTDGILFLINLDTKYDYISTSGVCINYFSDYRIDKIFDRIWDDMADENFGQAAYGFLVAVEDYYDAGKENDQHEVFGLEHDSGVSFSAGFFTLFAALIVGTVIYAFYSAQYKTAKPDTRAYILKNSLYFERNEDIYRGTNVNRVYSPRSSSSSSSGGHSHHSSTHHSSGGGRHGGGGRHR